MGEAGLTEALVGRGVEHLMRTTLTDWNTFAEGIALRAGLTRIPSTADCAFKVHPMLVIRTGQPRQLAHTVDVTNHTVFARIPHTAGLGVVPVLAFRASQCKSDAMFTIKGQGVLARTSGAVHGQFTPLTGVPATITGG